MIFHAVAPLCATPNERQNQHEHWNSIKHAATEWHETEDIYWLVAEMSRKTINKLHCSSNLQACNFNNHLGTSYRFLSNSLLLFILVSGVGGADFA